MCTVKRTKNIVGCLLFFTFLLLLTSCQRETSPQAGDPRRHLCHAFEAEVSGEIAGIPISAALTHIPPSASTSDTLTLTVTAPDALRGIVWCRRGEELTVTLNGICIDAAPWQQGTLTTLTELFAADAALLSVTRDKESGNYTAILVASDGEAYTVITDADGIPLRMRKGEELSVELLSFR